MLFVLTTADARVLDTVDCLAGDEDKELLLISDGAYLAREALASELAERDMSEVYVEQEALARRGIKPAGSHEAVDMDRIVELMLSSKKLIQL